MDDRTQKAEEKARDAREAWSSHLAKKEAVAARTVRLREERLSLEAVEREAAAAKPKSKTKSSKTKRG